MKRLFQLFKNDAERQVDIENHDESRKSNTASSSRLKMGHGRDVEAKIAYQYPKGKFRFPLIPDEQPAREKRTSAQAVKEWHQHEPKADNRAGRHAAPENSAAKQKHVESEPVHIQKQQPERVIRSNRPFTPTKVPSPIYGYKRPEKIVQHDSVEYELSTFEKENSLKPVQVDYNSAAEFVHPSTESTATVRIINDSGHSNAKSEAVNEEQEFYMNQNPLTDSIAAKNEFVKDELTATEESYKVDVVATEKETAEGAPAAIEENQILSVAEVEDALAEETLSEIQVSRELSESSNEEEDVTEGPAAIGEPQILTVEMEAALSAETLSEIQVSRELSESSNEEEDVTEGPAAIGELQILSVAEVEDVLAEETPTEIQVSLELSESSNEEEDVTEGPAAIGEPQILSVAEVEDVLAEETPLEIQVSLELNERVDEQEFINKGSESIEVNNDSTKLEAEYLAAKDDQTAIQQEPEKVKAALQQESVKEVLSPDVSKTNENPPQSLVKEQKVQHLPFNVIMLTQDKRKLEQKRKVIPISQREEIDDNKVLSLKEREVHEVYKFPPLDLLSPPFVVEEGDEWIEEQREILNSTLINFNVGAQVVKVTQGPSVTRFEVQPEPGVKVNKITNLSDDIKLSLAARDIRIEAPIPGKHTIGIEVPNRKSRPVLLSEIVKSTEFTQNESPLTAALGLDISGKPIVTDLRKMPHGLIAGATGSGKSVCINSILVSLLYKAKPEELKLLLIDPKMVELAPYNRIPHLVSPVITDVKAATAALKWAVDEMERRYELFAHTGVRDIHRFNEQAMEHKQYADKLPYIVIIIDELADLMMMSPADVEEAIARIAQKARACGIHLIIATQRPSVDVITGLIKANIPTRIAFSVSSQVDSRTIIDISGAEKLLGKGDMLFLENGSSKPFRLQGTFVSDGEIDEVVAFARKQGEPNYLFEQEELLKKAQINDDEDELFYEACEFVIAHGGASTSSLQRRFKIGYNRAARLIDMMEQQGFISESKGSKPRDVLITEEELETLQETSVMN